VGDVSSGVDSLIEKDPCRSKQGSPEPPFASRDPFNIFPTSCLLPNSTLLFLPLLRGTTVLFHKYGFTFIANLITAPKPFMLPQIVDLEAPVAALSRFVNEMPRGMWTIGSNLRKLIRGILEFVSTLRACPILTRNARPRPTIPFEAPVAPLIRFSGIEIPRGMRTVTLVLVYRRYPWLHLSVSIPFLRRLLQPHLGLPVSLDRFPLTGLDLPVFLNFPLTVLGLPVSLARFPLTSLAPPISLARFPLTALGLPVSLAKPPVGPVTALPSNPFLVDTFFLGLSLLAAFSIPTLLVYPLGFRI
jgi:hypothetical protein